MIFMKSSTLFCWIYLIKKNKSKSVSRPSKMAKKIPFNVIFATGKYSKVDQEFSRTFLFYQSIHRHVTWQSLNWMFHYLNLNCVSKKKKSNSICKWTRATQACVYVLKVEKIWRIAKKQKAKIDEIIIVCLCVWHVEVVYVLYLCRFLHEPE